MKTVLLRKFLTDSEAEVAKTFLESLGIRSSVGRKQYHSGNSAWATLSVYDQDLPRAEEAIKEFEANKGS